MQVGSLRARRGAWGIALSVEGPMLSQDERQAKRRGHRGWGPARPVRWVWRGRLAVRVWGCNVAGEGWRVEGGGGFSRGAGDLDDGAAD